ncbi:phage tail tape measure protein [Listeria rocourtiae]|uniref:phage tail tape measure protein n=1 Tax=Listeria rocourtiae TaxID=647910 RepID=UPI0003E8C2E9|nr:phage tail tape measure protein [Listeria rocourtiae]EUJ46662.1 tail tape measure protein [Listeria rocourtiae FSL F6-920]
MKPKQQKKSRVSSIKNLEDTQKNLEAQTEKLSSEFKLEQQAMADTATEAEKLAHAEKYVADQTELAEKKIENMERQLELTKQEYGENSTEALRMETALNQAKGGVSKLENELDELKTSSNNADEGMDKLNKTLSGGMMIAAAEQLAEIGEKLKEVGQYAFDAFRDVDDGLDTIITKTGATGKAGEALGEVFNNIAGNSKFDFQSIGDAVGELNTQFGFTDDVLEKNSLLLLKYAEINGTDVTDSTINARKSIEAYGLSYDDLGTVLDTTTSVAQATGLSVDDLNDKIISGAPQIKAMGLSYQEGAVLIGQLEQNGVDSAAALSSLGKATVVYAKDGKTLEQGLKGTIDKIKGAKSETEALNIASEVFGTKGAVRMVDAIKRGTLNLDDLADSAKNTSGTVSTTFDETLDSIDKQDQALNNIKLAMSELGAAISETLAPILDSLSSILQKVAKWFSGLSSTSKDVIVILGLVLVAVSALLPAIAAIAVVGGTVLAWIGLIVAAITIIIVIIKNWGNITKWLGKQWDNFKNFMSGVWEGIKNVFMAGWQAISDFFVKAWDIYWSILTAFWTPIIKFFAMIWEGIKNITVSLWNSTISFLTGVWQGIVNIAMTVWNGLVNVFTFIFFIGSNSNYGRLDNYFILAHWRMEHPC